MEGTRLTWVKEVDGKRVCSIHSLGEEECHLAIGAIDLTPLLLLGKKPRCEDIWDLIQCEVEDCEERQVVWDFCEQYDKLIITNLLVYLGLSPDRFRIVNSIHKIAVIDYGGTDALPEDQWIITKEDAETLGLRLQFAEFFDKHELKALNMLIKRGLETDTIKAIIQFDFANWNPYHDYYWVVVYRDHDEPITIYPNHPKYEEVRELVSNHG
jgi:tRNA-binding EMAP/Myf-like protein